MLRIFEMIFLFVERRGSGKCRSLLSHSFELIAEMGVCRVEEKAEAPSSVLTFLRNEMATTLGISSLPIGKLVSSA